MSASKSRLSYTDCFELFELALEKKKGQRIRFKDYGDANQLRLRLNAARSIDRKENEEAGNPLRSRYDRIRLMVRAIDGGVYLIMENIEGVLDGLEIEDLDDIAENEEETERALEEDPAEE